MAKKKLTKEEMKYIDIIIKHTRNMFEELYNVTVEDAPLSYTCFGLEIIHAVTRFHDNIFNKQQ